MYISIKLLTSISLLVIINYSLLCNCKKGRHIRSDPMPSIPGSDSQSEESSDDGIATTLSPEARVQKLVTHLLANYTKVVRPRLNQSRTVDVYFDIRIKQLVNVDIHSSQVQFMISLLQQWVDEGLMWNYEHYGGRAVKLNPNDVWIPDVMFINSVDNFEHLKEVTILPVRVNWMGKVLWQIPLLKTTRCDMDVKYFPYDIQTCDLDLSSWRMLGSQINLEFMEDYSGEAAEEISKFRHPEWNLIHVERKRSVVGYGGYEVPTLKFQYSFHRQSKYFEYTMVYPTVLICLMAFISFNLPNGCGEKISFSITILLALVLNLCLIDAYIPRSSANFPLMGEFFFGGICIVGASVVQSVMILLMHYSSEKPKAPSKLLRMIVLGFLSKVTFTSLKGLESLESKQSQKDTENSQSTSEHGQQNTSDTDSKKEKPKDGNSIPLESKTETNTEQKKEKNAIHETSFNFADAALIKTAELVQQKMKEEPNRHYTLSSSLADDNNSDNQLMLKLNKLDPNCFEVLMTSLRNLEMSAKEWALKEREDLSEHFIKLEWEIIAQIFDRLLMIAFTFICFICAIVFKLRVYYGEKAALEKFPKTTEAPEYYYYYYDYDYDYDYTQ
ncbi:acetylcholine receptor subunit alpha-like isoform X2 [Convolutriloba macropyga]|uniref:acetylcholine receptor subunit alpha-like isoform X2 n=1 Tax=Convolutriloba macropyga TaxID=536237 RepID=UPI003F51F1F2